MTYMKVVTKKEIFFSSMSPGPVARNALFIEQKIHSVDIHLNVTTKETINVQMLK